MSRQPLSRVKMKISVKIDGYAIMVADKKEVLRIHREAIKKLLRFYEKGAQDHSRAPR